VPALVVFVALTPEKLLNVVLFLNLFSLMSVKSKNSFVEVISGATVGIKPVVSATGIYVCDASIA
jgi:hypothetical protein